MSDNHPKIRAARQGDAEAIAWLSTQLGYPAAGQEMARRLNGLLADENQAIFVAERAVGRLAGWVHVYLRELLVLDRHAELGGLVVAEEDRNRGVGQALLAAAECWVRAQGVTLLIVRSNRIRQDAHRFYLRQGYEGVKESVVFHKRLG